MKKFLIALLLVFVANLGCKKMVMDDAPCACSPVSYPQMQLVLKNSNGVDLLDPNIPGFYSKPQIKFFVKENGRPNRPIDFLINKPFTYPSGQFGYYQISAGQLIVYYKSVNDVIYMELDNQLHEINFEIDPSTRTVNKLRIDNKDMPKETTGYLANLNIFYWTLEV